jgi:hypothetical protein
MQAFRQHIIFRLFWLFMAVHIFNCSVDTPDLKPDYIPEDLTYNDMESVAEIALEKVFDIKNAVAERDENDTEDGNCFDLKKNIIYYYQTKVKKNSFNDIGLQIVASTNYDEQYSSQFHPEISPPPPKA